MRERRFELFERLDLDLDRHAGIQCKRGLHRRAAAARRRGDDALFDLTVRCSGDLHVYQHHSVEDVGIALGDECVVEAGLYVTAGTRVTMPDGQIVKARDLSGASHILFRRNSVTGTVEARPNNAVWGGLNDILHSHN